MENPTYHDLGDHSESVQADYDPKQITFEKLLEEFWNSPNSCNQGGSQQYRSVIFYHDDQQKKLALASRARVASKQSHAMDTPVLPVGKFTLAEDYHQKFYLRQHPELAKEVTAAHPDLAGFVNSTVATKLNAYLAGHGTPKMLDKEIDSFGLSKEGNKRLRQIVGDSSPTLGDGK